MTKENHLAERRARLLQAGARVSRNITSILDPEELLRRTVNIICDEYDFYYAGVFLIDDTRQWAVLRAGRGESGKAMLAEGHKLKVDGHSMIGRATGEQRAIIALDVGEEPVHFKNPHLPGTRSEMALPLMVGNELIGALTVQSVEEAAFSDEDITSLQAMADQLAVAINNARLHLENRRLLARAERRTLLLEAAAEVGRNVTSILDMDELFNKMVDIICDTYGFYYAGVFLLDEAGEWAVLRAGRGEAGKAMLAANHRLAVGGHSMIGAATSLRKARIALDVGEEAVHFKNPYLPHTRSEMALPLMVKERVIGAVTVQSVEEAAFSDEDITSLQAMADQLAVAINNAQLLLDLEAAHAELLRSKTFEAIATATTKAIHWIGNKAFPISTSVAGLYEDLDALEATGGDKKLVASIREDLAMIAESADLIVAVKEHLIGPARERQPEPLMLDDVIHDTVLMMQLPPDMVTYEIQPDLPYAVADATQLSRAFMYVLRNALEAMEEVEDPHILIEIAASEDDNFVAVRISDVGPGIPEDELDKIWAAFYGTKGGMHAGLGLSAAMQILRQIDGKIAAANRAEGGAQFELLVPVERFKPAKAQFPGGKSILLIDDADPWSRFVEKSLKEARNTVTRSPDGQPDPAAFDLILVDNVLEEADVEEILKKLQKVGAAGRTLVVASDLRVERATDLMNYGIRDVVAKPYTPAGLAEIVS